MLKRLISLYTSAKASLDINLKNDNSANNGSIKGKINIGRNFSALQNLDYSLAAQKKLAFRLEFLIMAGGLLLIL